jgi:hypothetical protein
LPKALVTGACLSLLVLAAPAKSQQPAVRNLGAPEAVSAEGFTRVVAVRELADRRLVLVDMLDRLVRVLSPTLARVAQLGRHGSGPGEYLTPMRIFPLPGDSFAIHDQNNGRMLVIRSDGSMSGFLDRYGVWSDARAPAAIKQVPQKADGRGYFYAQLAPVPASRRGTTIQVAPRAPLLRWQVGAATPDTVAWVGVAESRRSGSAGPGGLVTYRPLGPFETYPQWDVSADGTIGIVYPEPYHVEVVLANGTTRRGPTVRAERVPVTEADKAAWREAGQWVVGVRSSPAGREVGTFRRAVEEPAEWPRFLPPFLIDAVRFAPDGRLWVQRATNAGSPGLLDVFDGHGRCVERVTVRPGRKLVGFGRNVVYLVHQDDVDLEYVERYRLDSA